MSVSPGEAAPLRGSSLWEEPGPTSWPHQIPPLIRADPIFPPACPRAIDEHIMAAVFPRSAPLLSAIGLVESVNFFGAQRVAVLF